MPGREPSDDQEDPQHRQNDGEGQADPRSELHGHEDGKGVQADPVPEEALSERHQLHPAAEEFKVGDGGTLVVREVEIRFGKVHRTRLERGDEPDRDHENQGLALRQDVIKEPSKRIHEMTAVSCWLLGFEECSHPRATFLNGVAGGRAMAIGYLPSFRWLP